MRLLFLIAVLVLAPALRAQSAGPVPINSGDVDYITTITNAIDGLITAAGGVFLATGHQILTAIGIIRLVVCGLRLASESARPGTRASLGSQRSFSSLRCSSLPRP